MFPPLHCDRLLYFTCDRGFPMIFSDKETKCLLYAEYKHS